MPIKIKKFSAAATILSIHLASLQQIIFINPIYFLLFWIIFDAKGIYFVFLGVTIFTGIVHSLIAVNDTHYFFLLKEYVQLSFDILIAGSIIAIIKKTDVNTLTKGVNLIVNVFLVVAGLSLIDYYFVNFGLNSLLSQMTLWPNIGSGFPRLSLTFSNPNWATFNMFLLLVIIVELCKSHVKFYWVVVKIVLLILFFQSKTGILLSLFYVVFSLMKFNLRYLFVVLFISVISTSSFWILLVNQTQGQILIDSASYLNRMEMYKHVFVQSDLWPKGLPTYDFYTSIRNVSNEDTIPAILKFLYCFGWIIFTTLMLSAIALSVKNNTKSLAVAVIGFSISYSYFDVSIVAAQAMVIISFLCSPRLQR